MKRSFTIPVYILSFFLSLGLSCKKNVPDDAALISDNLHLNFKTPDWEQNIDCSQLDLPAYALNSQTSYTFGTPPPTNNAFFISYPKDSSAMVAPGNLKKYAVVELGNHTSPFEFSLKIPIIQDSKIYMISQPGFTDDSYNQVMAIKYVGGAGKEAYFQIKGRYKMAMVEANTSKPPKPVSGTYHFKVKTTRL